MPGRFLYSPRCSASPLVPSLCEIVQPTQRGILSDIDKHWYAHKPRALLIYNMCRHLACTNSAITTHTHQPPLCEGITLLPFAKWVLSDVKWARCAAEYRGAELGRAACVCLSHCCLWVCTCLLTPVCSVFCASIHLHVSFSLCRENGEACLLRTVLHYGI